MRLKDVCNVFLDGDWIENKDQSPAGIRLIQTGNIGNGIFLEKKERARFISEETFARLKCNEIFPGDILVSRLPDPIGRACIIPDTDERMITAVDCTICRVDKSMILPEFLCYFMRSAMYCNAIMENVTGTTRKRISRKNLGNVNVRLFPLDDQQAIVHKLDYITKIIKLRKKELAQLDYLIKARFVEVFRIWENKYTEEPLNEFLENITYGFTNPMPDTEEGPWKITAKDVVDGKINFNTARKTSQESYNKLTAKSKPQLGNVLLTKDGTLGRTAVVDRKNICVNQSVAVLRVNGRIAPDFLSVLLQMPKYQDCMMANAGGGTIKHIYITKIIKMLIIVPTMEEQKVFLDFVHQVDKSKVVA